MRQEPIDIQQTEENDLTVIANTERTKLLPKNDFQQSVDEYSSTNKDAIADGDDYGKGTGNFLDVYNDAAGAKFDITERKSNLKINEYSPKNTYPNF